jgi:hypothetical protein
MNRPAQIHGKFFWGMLLGIAALAAAHHGNPQAPSPAWKAWLPAGIPQSSQPAGPGR